jgi:hypothetical protein
MAEADERGRVHGLAVAAALTVLSASVGVDARQVMAADPPDQLRSNQSKIAPPPAPGSQQSKFDKTLPKHDQQKLPSKQSKDLIMPGEKPINPPR